MKLTVYISIGNSDDKLTQDRWSRFILDMNIFAAEYATEIHGAWFSESSSQYQNACWCLIIDTDEVDVLKAHEQLKDLAYSYDQASITWAALPEVTLIKP